MVLRPYLHASSRVKFQLRQFAKKMRGFGSESGEALINYVGMSIQKNNRSPADLKNAARETRHASVCQYMEEQGDG